MTAITGEPAQPTLDRADRIMIGGATLGIVLSAVVTYAHANDVLAFVVTAATVALMAALVGRSVEQLGDRFGPGATGVLQSALGNLPELFVTLFALHAGLYDVVRAAIVGSILANVLLVLGLAFIVVSVLVGKYSPGGWTWWYWLLIPASTLIGKGISEIIRSRQARSATPAAGQPQMMTGARLESLPSLRSGELMSPVPSVTEGTTRHLGAEAPTRHFDPTSSDEKAP